MIGAGGGSRTRTSFRTTDFKPVSRVLTTLYYALPSRIYRRFSRQSRLRLARYRHITPSSSPHLNQFEGGSWRRFFLRSQVVTSITFNCTKSSVYPGSLSECRQTFPSCHNHRRALCLRTANTSSGT